MPEEGPLLAQVLSRVEKKTQSTVSARRRKTRLLSTRNGPVLISLGTLGQGWTGWLFKGTVNVPGIEWLPTQVRDTHVWYRPGVVNLLYNTDPG
uniref:Uncharacterized protein n=1 Tax=Timema tahoe TaxID=61484 RepID=A0A7R9IMD2_9NEOP|nr:unnamed protein product [Timema tahoe]